MSSKPRALFFGTPDFAVPCLEALHRIADVRLVISQPDRPKGRGQQLQATPVKAKALELGLEVHQPTKVRTPEFAELLKSHEADLAVVVAYGRILPKAVLDAPRKGCVNIHASLLPRWRGAAPIQWAIASGDKETGVCLMEMSEGLDEGPVFARAEVSIDENATSEEIFHSLSKVGSELLELELLAWLDGKRIAVPQSEDGLTLARMIEKKDGFFSPDFSAEEMHNRVRGFTPWPGVTALFGEANAKPEDSLPLKLVSTRLLRGQDAEMIAHASTSASTGHLWTHEKRLFVRMKDTALELVSVQPQGKRAMSPADFAAGYLQKNSPALKSPGLLEAKEI